MSINSSNDLYDGYWTCGSTCALSTPRMAQARRILPTRHSSGFRIDLKELSMSDIQIPQVRLPAPLPVKLEQRSARDRFIARRAPNRRMSRDGQRPNPHPINHINPKNQRLLALRIYLSSKYCI